MFGTRRLMRTDECMSIESQGDGSKHALQVSVVIPTRDRASVVGRAIRSVLAQTFHDWELIVVDDASTDGTIEVVQSFADPRLRVVRLPRACGAGQSRNEGVAVARGALVAFLDSDDEWAPTKLAQQVARISQDSRVAVVYCRHQNINDWTGRLTPVDRALPEGNVFMAMVRGWNPVLSGLAVKRSVFLAAGGFDVGLPAFIDYDLSLRISQDGSCFAGVGKPLVTKHNYGMPQISTTPRLMLEGAARMQQNWGPLLRDRVSAHLYRRWRAQLHTQALHAQVRDAIHRGHYLTAWQGAIASCEFAPWSARRVAGTLALATLGAGGYAMLLGLKDRVSRLVDPDA